MKKLIFGLIATVFLTNFTFCQEKLSMLQLENLGKKHNELIINAINNLNRSQKSINSENIIAEFNSIDIDLSKINSNVKNVINDALKNSEISLQTIKLNDNFSKSSYSYLKEIDNSIVDDYNLTKNNLEKLKLKAVKDINLNANDFNLIVGTIEVAKNSADLWMSDKSNYLNLNKTLNKRSGKSCVKADAAASSAYFTGIGVAAIFGMSTPVTAAALLGGWAISAGIGSAYHWIGLE